MTPDGVRETIMAMVGMGSVAVLWTLGQRLLDQVRTLVEKVTRQEERMEALAKDVGRLEAEVRGVQDSLPRLVHAEVELAVLRREQESRRAG